MRNSLLTALMPTASTSQILGSNECFEPITNNIYVRKTLSGEFIVASEYLVRDLIREGLWSKEMYEEIIYHNGSVQNISRIPESIRRVYKTAFEIPGLAIVRQAAERGPFIDQTQSMNLFMAKPDFDKLSKALVWGWKNGLKTGCYYLRTLPSVDPIKFGLDIEAVQRIEKQNAPVLVCAYRPRGQPAPEGCDVCSA
jgi:ribonucleotide reductase alpha subunit